MQLVLSYRGEAGLGILVDAPAGGRRPRRARLAVVAAYREEGEAVGLPAPLQDADHPKGASSCSVSMSFLVHAGHGTGAAGRNTYPYQVNYQCHMSSLLSIDSRAGLLQCADDLARDALRPQPCRPLG